MDWGYLNITVAPNTVPQEYWLLVKVLYVSSRRCSSGTEQLLQTFHAGNVEQKQEYNPRRQTILSAKYTTSSEALHLHYATTLQTGGYMLSRAHVLWINRVTAVDITYSSSQWIPIPVGFSVYVRTAIGLSVLRVQGTSTRGGFRPQNSFHPFMAHLVYHITWIWQTFLLLR